MMEDMDLIEFCSPRVYANSRSPKKRTFSNSPGSNPFDVLWNLAETFPNNNKEAMAEISFQPLDTSFNSFDSIFKGHSGREFFSVTNVDELPRESLGILKIEVLNTTMEDLGLTSTGKSSNFFGSNKSVADTSLLNTAFLCPSSYCDNKSMYLSNASLSPNPLDFNSGSLEASEPSKIYSITSSQFSRNFDLLSKTENVLNDAFINSIKASLHQNEREARLRLFSLPDLNAVINKIDTLLSKSQNYLDTKISASGEYVGVSCKADLDDAFNDSVFIEANHFAAKFADGSILSTTCFEDDLLDCTSPPALDEDVEICEPIEVNNEDIFKCIDKLVPSSETQNTLIPASDCQINGDGSTIPELPEPRIPHNLPMKEQCSLELKQNLSNVFSRKSASSNSSTSKDPNELLHNLSEIINTENRDAQQNLEGQKLLFGLADILCSNVSLQHRIDSLDDSGHSSFEQEDQQTESDHNSYEVLDLRIASKSTGTDQVLDLSLKSKRHSNSFTFPSQKVGPSLVLNTVKPRTSSASSTSSLDHSKVNNFGAVKLKPKRIEENVALKKGPLKAVIPVGSMSKRQSYGGKMSSVSVTPPKMENTQSALFRVKRTSTPIMDPKLKPMAQSTPDGPNSELEKPKSPKPMAQSTPDGPNLELEKTKSPYNTPSKISKLKPYSPVSSQISKKVSVGKNLSENPQLNKSSPLGSAGNLSNRHSVQAATLIRRHSESELKSNKTSLTLKRSYSIGKSSKIGTIATEKVKNSVVATKKTMLKNPAGPDIQKPSVLQEKNRGLVSTMKSFNLLRKTKKNKTDKENVHNS